MAYRRKFSKKGKRRSFKRGFKRKGRKLTSYRPSRGGIRF